jgi:hypothetical protein
MRPASVRQSDRSGLRGASQGQRHSPYRISAGGDEESVARLEALAKLMDGVFVIPGTNLRLGLDAVIGVVPVAGDSCSPL